GLTVLAGGTPAAAATCPTTASGGASVPFRTVEAECSATNGSAVGPDYSQADGSSGRLTVSVNGTKAALPVTSRYSYVDTSWIPGAKTHHFFDDARLLLGQNLSAGTKVRVQADAGDVGQAT